MADSDDPIAEDGNAARAVANPAAGGGGGGSSGGTKLTKEQIAVVSADIAAVTRTMQEQLAAISAEVSSLKGQIDGGAGGLGDIKKELDGLRNQAGLLDGGGGGGGAARGGAVPGGARQRQLGGGGGGASRANPAGRMDHQPRGLNSSNMTGSAGTQRWSEEDKRLLSRKKVQADRERPLSGGVVSNKTIFIIVFVFLLVGPFRQLVFKLLKELSLGVAKGGGADVRSLIGPHVLKPADSLVSDTVLQ